MGSKGKQNEQKREYRVLVTGFGACTYSAAKTNPSWLIANRLPSEHVTANNTSFHIHVHPSPINVAYKTVRQLIPSLISPTGPNLRHNPKKGKSTPDFDAVLHIGLAPGQDFYAIEAQAHRDGYDKKDVAGQTLEGDSFWDEVYHAPAILKTTFDMEAVQKKWKASQPKEDLRVSEDAGMFLCEFIYFTSLVEYWRHDTGGPRPVLFLHVPDGQDEADLKRGRKITLGLLEALVESLRSKEDELHS